MLIFLWSLLNGFGHLAMKHNLYIISIIKLLKYYDMFSETNTQFSIEKQNVQCIYYSTFHHPENNLFFFYFFYKVSPQFGKCGLEIYRFIVSEVSRNLTKFCEFSYCL